MIARQRVWGCGLLAWVMVTLIPIGAAADENDPPTRIARLSLVEGSVSFQPGGTDQWVSPPINRPLTTGDQLWSDRDGRAELQLDGSLLRLSRNTAVSFLNLGDRVTQVQLSSGTLLVNVRRLDDDETYEIDTPNVAFTVLRPGVYRLNVDPTGNSTAIGVRHGQGEVTGDGTAYAVHADEYDTFSGTNSLNENIQPYGREEDDFDTWSAGRDRRWEHSESARYVSPDVVGYEDLDSQGTWSPTPEYGNVWFPSGLAADWAPYHEGHWVFVAPWGYTWVDDRPWGFAPFHYGRWICPRGTWGWVPAPPPVFGAVYVRPVYAPALVAWVGVGAGVAWFALGPREVYVPSYPVSRRYVNAINISNTAVNTTVINNVYNTTIVNKTVNVNNVNNVTYVNRNVPGAVMATSSQAFTSAQPVARNRMPVAADALAGAQVRALAPAAVPSRQAVLGAGHLSNARPPEAVQTRAIVARIAPPPPPPNFERRREAIQNNAGRLLSPVQVRQIQSSVSPHSAPVSVASPAKSLLAPLKTVAAPSRAAAPTPETARPGLNPAPTRPMPSFVHPSEIPAPPRPPSPSVANSVLERQHLQEQQQLHAQQEADRQRIQQQQELQHQQLAKQQAEESQRQRLQQQLELQHQQQTQQLIQRHDQEQQQLQERQQEQRRQQPVSPPPPTGHRPEPPPGVKPH